MNQRCTFILCVCFSFFAPIFTSAQCDVDPSWVITPASLSTSYNSSEFPQGTVCPGADPIIDEALAGTPTLMSNDGSADCDLSQITLLFQDTWSSSDPATDCSIIINRLWKGTYSQMNGGTGQVAGIQEIEIVDDVPPQLSCPSDLTTDLSTTCDESDPNVEIESGFIYGSGVVTEADFLSLTDGMAFDNCDTELEISYSDGPVTVNAGNCPLAFITWERSWEVEDNCGLTAQCVQLISLYDNSVPIFTSMFPDFDENMMITACDVFDPAVEATSGFPFNESSVTIIDEADVLTLGAFVEDNCKDAYSIEYAYIDIYIDTPGNCPELGQIFRVWTATDHCGNVGSDRQEIFLYDNEGPEVSGCPTDVDIFVFSPESCDQNNPQIESLTGYEFSFGGTSISDPNDFPGTAIDNCDGSVIADVSYQDVVTQIGCESGSNVSFEITRTWSLSDACGNATTCEQIISLIDLEPPVLVGGANFFIDQDFNNPTPMYFETVNCEQEVAWIDPTASEVFDNCESFDDLVIWKSHESPFLFREGVTEVQYVFRDACGNQTSVVWEVTVVCVPCTPQNVFFQCYDPPTLCDLSVINTFSSCTPMSPNPAVFELLCDTAFIENPTYFRFVAAEENISIIYLVENCANSLGLQFAVTDPCDPLSCYDDSRSACLQGFGNFLATGLTVGNIYQIIIDGCAGDQCEYTIGINTGPFEFPDFQSQTPDIESLTSLSCHPDDFRLCQGQQVSFYPEGSGDAIYNFCWSLDNQSGVTALNNQDNCGQAVVGTPQGMAFSCSNDYSSCGPLELQFDEVGTYRLCLIEIENGCDHADLDDYCWDIEVVPNGALDFGTHYVCESDFPWSVDVPGPNGESWPGPPLFPGEESIVDTDYCGCTYDYMIDVRILPQMQGEGDVRVCFEDRENWQDPILDVDWEDLMNDYVPPAMGSEIFVSFGSAQQGYDGDYCDSMVFYNVYVYDLPGVILEEPGPACDAILNFEIDTLLFPEFMDDDDLDFVWKDEMGNTVDVGTTISVTSDGIYTLEVQYEIDEWTICNFVFSEEVVLGTQVLAAPTFVEAPTQTCFNSVTGLVFSVPASSVATYTWTVVNGAFTTNATGEEITVGINDPSMPLQVSVFANSMCGTSPTATTSLNVIAAPIIDLLPVQDVCINQPVSIISNIISGSVDDYFWIVDDPTANWDMISSGNQSTIEVSWSTPGLQSFSLYVEDIGGCESNIVTAQVNVLEPLEDPTASCVMTSSSSVTIEWIDAPGSSGTALSVLTGQTGTGNASQYTVTGLSAGENVEFSLQALGGAYPCGDGEIITFSCEASDCNLNPMISTPQDLICLDGSQDIFQLEETNGYPGGIWSGNGVNPDGLFDPSDAGPGATIITYTVEDLALDCSTSVSLTITMFDALVEEFMIGMDSLCIDELTTINFQNNSGVIYTWDFDVGNNNPSALTSSFDISYSTPGVKYIELIAMSGADCESVYGTEIFVRPPLDFVGIFCDSVTTNSVLFDWPENAQVESFEAEVFINGVSEYTINPSIDLEISNLDEGDLVEVILTAYDIFGCSEVITNASCTAQDCPQFDIDLSASSMVECWVPSGISISLTQMTFDESGNMANGTGEWTGTGVNSQTGLFTPTGPGVYTILYRFEEDGSNCTSTEEIQIQILDEPTSDFSIAQDELCIAEELLLSYDGDYNPGIDFNWASSLNDSDYMLVNNQDGTFSVTLLNAESGTFSLETVVGDCISDISSLSFTVEDVPELPQVSCTSTLSTVMFSWDEVPCADGYSILYDGVQLPVQQDPFFEIEGLAESEMVSIEVEVISSCLCDFPSVILASCTAQACTSADINFEAGLEQSFCASEIPSPFMIDVSVSGADIDGSGSYEWSGVGVDATGLVDLVDLSAGEYPISVSYTEDGCNYMQSLIFEIFEEPNLDINVIDAPCETNPFGTAVFNVNAVEPFALSINNENIAVGSNQLAAGNYEITLVDAMGCELIQSFEIGIAADPFIILDGPGFIKLDSMAQFTFSLGESPSSIDWILNDELYQTVDCLLEDCNTLEFMPPISGDYELCVTATYGDDCTITECLNFLVANVAISDIYIPNVFNPESETGENQGLNLFVTGFDVMVEEVSIFDRWGSVVYNSEEVLNVGSGNYETLWNGDFGDQEFMTGVYVYLVKISIDGQEEFLVGDVSVIK